MLHVMPFMGPDLEINSILFYSILFCIQKVELSDIVRSQKANMNLTFIIVYTKVSIFRDNYF